MHGELAKFVFIRSTFEVSK